jgi:hypothetical protein
MYTDDAQPDRKYNQASPDGKTNAQHPVARCANCDIEILWPPTVAQGKPFCCTGCAAGGPCNCDYSLHRSVTIAGVIHYLD